MRRIVRIPRYRATVAFAYGRRSLGNHAEQPTTTINATETSCAGSSAAAPLPPRGPKAPPPAAPLMPQAAPPAPETSKAAPQTPKATPAAPEVPKAAPAAPQTPKAAPAAPQTPKAAPAAPEVPKAAPAAPQTPKAAPAAPEVPKAAPAAPQTPKAAPAAPQTPKAAPAAPEVPKAAPAAPQTPKAAPAAPEVPKAAPAAPQTPKAAPAAPQTPKAAPAAPEVPKAAPAAPQTPKAAPQAPKAAPAAPEAPKAAPAAPQTPKTAPAAPQTPKAAPAAPEAPKAAPAAPQTPKAAPQAPKAAPAAPEAPKAAPAAPQTPKTAPAAPQTPKAAPAAPEVPKAAPAAPQTPKAAPQAPKAAPAAPEAPKAAPAAPQTPKTAPAAPQTPKAAPAAPQTPKAAPAAPEVPKAAPAAPQTPKAAPAAPEVPKAAPAAPQTPKAAPAAPQTPKAAPAAPEVPKAAPAAPQTPKAAPAAPQTPKTAPAAPQTPKAAPAAPQTPKAAPAAPEVPKAAPAAPQTPKTAPAAPQTPKAAPAAPQTPKAAPAAPQTPKAAPAAPEAPKAAPAAPQTPKAAPAAPQTPKAAPAAPQTPKAAPAAPEAPKAAPAAPQTPKAAPAAPQTPKAAPAAPEPPKAPGAFDKRRASSNRGEDVRSRDHRARNGRTGSSRAGSVSSQPVAPRPPKAPAAPQMRPAPPPSPPLSADAALDDLFFAVSPSVSQADAWRRSMAAEVAEAVQESIAHRPLKPAKAVEEQMAKEREALNLEWKKSPGADNQENVNVDAEMAAPMLKELPDDLAASLDRHELPSLDEDLDGKNQSEVTQEVSQEPIASCENTSPQPVEQLPVSVWNASASSWAYRQNSSTCIRVSYDDARGVAMVQLVEQPGTAMSAILALSAAMDQLEARCQESGMGRRLSVWLCTAPSLDFFSAEQHPLELPTNELETYMVEREALLDRLVVSSTRFHWVASASGQVKDFGADLFFACQHRQLVKGAKGEAWTTTVGFPSLRQGLFPSQAAVKSLMGALGTEAAARLLPSLHTYDPWSFESKGLLQTEAVLEMGADEMTSHTEPRLSFEAWCLRHLCRTPTTRRMALRYFFLSGELSYLLQQQTSSCEDVGLLSSTDGEIGEMWVAYALDCVLGNLIPPTHAAEVFQRCDAAVMARQTLQRQRALAHRRLPPLTSSRILRFDVTASNEVWESMVTSLDEDPIGATVLFDVTASTVDRTRLFLLTHQRGAFAEDKHHNYVIVGDAAVAQPMMQLLPCCAVVSPAACLRLALSSHAGPFSSLQEIHSYARPNWPVDLRSDAITAAVAYLQQRGTPYVLCSSRVSRRLLARYCREVCQLLTSCPAVKVEAAAKEMLGLSYGPLRLMDIIGMREVNRMISEWEAGRTFDEERDQLTVGDGLRRMAEAGLLGQGYASGGFYAPGNDVGVPRQEVVDQWFGRIPTTMEIAHRLVAAVLDEGLELLSHRQLLSVDDFNMLSMAALGFSDYSGGPVTWVEQHGGFQTFMRQLSETRTGTTQHRYLRKFADGGFDFTEEDLQRWRGSTSVSH